MLVGLKTRSRKALGAWQNRCVSASERALELAREVGFDLAGVAPCVPPPDAERFEAWLERGEHAGLDYLARNRERIVDPRRVLPEGKSLLVVGLAHSRPAFALQDGARIARYAVGRDYHNLAGDRLRKLARALQREGLVRDFRSVVDAGPVLERSHAARAGLGFLSKAANLLHPDFGPWFFLGELLIDAELDPTASPPPGSCGTCRACIDACPTGAIREPGRVDANRCISYHTIENRGSIPTELRASFGPWVFGCDVCSEVCPWGRAAPDLAQRFGTHAGLANLGLVELLELRQPLSAVLPGSPLQRPGREGLARNAAIALGNRPSDAGRSALLRALSFDPSALVREAAAWALMHGYAQETPTRAVVERAGAHPRNESGKPPSRRSES